MKGAVEYLHNLSKPPGLLVSGRPSPSLREGVRIGRLHYDRPTRRALLYVTKAQEVDYLRGKENKYR
jgi:hypothetical protein